MATSLETKCEILADIWLNFRNDEEFIDFVTYNDLGLPLAYAISSGVVAITDKAQSFIEETFTLLLASLGIEEDMGYETFGDILDIDE